MFKITAIVSLMLIGTTIWAASLSCDSCGSECASACGTRHFRSCCFNYLRRKRGPDTVKLLSSNTHNNKLESSASPKLPFFIVQNIPEQWFSNVMSGGFKPYFVEDNIDNRLQTYDA